MVKVYYSYEFNKPVGQYSWNNSNLVILKVVQGNHSNRNTYILSAVNQYIAIICLKTGEVLKYLQSPSKTTQMVRVISTTTNRIYAGFEDGLIVCFNITDMLLNYEVQFIVDTHNSAVTSILPSILVDDLKQDSLSSDTQLFTSSEGGTIAIYDVLSQQTQKITGAHKGPVTQLCPIAIMLNGTVKNCLVSIGKDGYLKVWDLSNLLCIGVVGMMGEALTMHVNGERQLIYVGMDNEKVNIIKLNSRGSKGNNQMEQQGEKMVSKICQLVGTFVRGNYSKSLQMVVQSHYLYILNSDKALQLYQLQSSSQIEKKKRRLASRKKGKNENMQAENQIPMRKYSHASSHAQQPQKDAVNQYELSLKFIGIKTLIQKMYSLTMTQNCLYFNGAGNVYALKFEETANLQSSILSKLTHSIGKTFQLQLQYPFVIQRSQKQIAVYPNAVLESDSQKLFKDKVNTAKNTKNQRLFTIEGDDEIKWCKIFNQGFLLFVTQKKLCIYDLAKNQEVFSREEQWNGCWIRGSNCLLWRQNIISKFQLGYNKEKQIQLKLLSEHRCSEKIREASALNGSFAKYLLNLQNNSIVVNYADSHKNFLTLHGHKLPINCFSIASDDNIMATGSIDKDIRIWDLQFGHSIKTLFAHKAPVTAVQFVRDTHYLWSGGRDGMLKMWDMDTHQLIIELDELLNGEVKDIKITSNGQHLIAGGVDGGFRVWTKTDNQIVAADQQEKNNQKILIQDYALDKFRKINAQSQQQKGNNQQQENIEKVRYDDLKHGEEIIEALQNSQHPTKIVQLIKKVPPSNLRSSLSFLHKKHVQKLQNYVKLLIQKDYEVELCFRVIDALSSSVIHNYLGGIKGRASNIKFNIESQSTGTSKSLGSSLREKWQKDIKILRINREMLKLLGTCIKEEKDLF